MISSMKRNKVILWGQDRTTVVLISLQTHLCPPLKTLSAKIDFKTKQISNPFVKFPTSNKFTQWFL